MSGKRVRFGVVGVKGFSQRHVVWIQRAAESGAPVEVAAAATILGDPEAVAAGAELALGGARIVTGYDDLLAMKDRIDIVTLPVGIHLHAPLAIQALEAGFTVYMEKPVAGTVDEAARIIAAEKKSAGRLFVGYQTLLQPSIWELKRRLLAGLIGRLQRIVVTVAWPRAMSYYHRNRWAGKLAVDGCAIYDSPSNNSAAHFLNAALFLAGSSEGGAALPVGAQAELYRAAPIESADSVFFRLATREGVDIVYNASQSCLENREAAIDIVGDAGRVEIVDRFERTLAPWTVVDVRGNRRLEGDDIPHVEIFARVAEAFLNPDMREMSFLDTAARQTLANQMTFTATEIRTVPGEFLERVAQEDGDELIAVRDMNEALDYLRRDGMLPHEAGRFGWAVPGGKSSAAKVRELTARLEGE